ncbi:MAG: DUF4143 domain-containing protein [Cruoricaptor ignavus]|nr:DUF4143 domain-containing protein [Cruoricaptor ignavus]
MIFINKGRLLENIVFLELLRRGREVYYFSGKNECDFLVKEGTQITEAIQVAYELNNENYKREIAGLSEAMRIFSIGKGVLLIFENSNNFTEELPENITIIPVYKWLLEVN